MEAIYIDLSSFHNILKKEPFIRIRSTCGLESQHLLYFANYLISKGIHVSTFLNKDDLRVIDIYFVENR